MFGFLDFWIFANINSYYVLNIVHAYIFIDIL